MAQLGQNQAKLQSTYYFARVGNEYTATVDIRGGKSADRGTGRLIRLRLDRKHNHEREKNKTITLKVAHIRKRCVSLDGEHILIWGSDKYINFWL